MPQPDLPLLRGGRDNASRAVLILHGGREQSHASVSSTQPAYLRMLDFQLALRKAATAETAVYLLRFRVRGWNGEDAAPDPVADAEWALDELGRRHPGAAIAMLGHSMGGRTAFAAAGHDGVVGVCALAPWLPQGEPLPEPVDGRRFVIAHGTADQMTSPAGSLAFATRLRTAGADVARFELLAGGKHALLDHRRLWRRFAVETTLGLVGDRPLPAGVAASFGQPADSGLADPLAAAVGG